MTTCIITGSLGLVGSTAVTYFANKFDKIVGVDNDLRQQFFDTSGFDNMPTLKNYTHLFEDIRYVNPKIFNDSVKLVIHAAGQPSHDWATTNVLEDFKVNALGTVRLLELVRHHAPDAVFIFCSTNKVYGDYPNNLRYTELPTRYDYPYPFSESIDVDNKLHSFFGCSKLSADLYTQEYGKHLGLKTGTFRAGCITGRSHHGAKLHGFLSYLIKCLVSGRHYEIYGYKGKQVRDNIHAFDLVAAFDEFYKSPLPGEVFNIGGGVHANCSILEAIELAQKLSGKTLDFSVSKLSRTGDHQWWISDVTKFRSFYPKWRYRYNLTDILSEML